MFAGFFVSRDTFQDLVGNIRVQLFGASRVYTMGEFCLRFFCDIRFNMFPLPFFVMNFFTARTYGNKATDCLSKEFLYFFFRLFSMPVFSCNCQNSEDIEQRVTSASESIHLKKRYQLNGEDWILLFVLSISHQFQRSGSGEKKPYRYQIGNSKSGLWLGLVFHTNKPIGGARQSGNSPVAAEVALSSR